MKEIRQHHDQFERDVDNVLSIVMDLAYQELEKEALKFLPSYYSEHVILEARKRIERMFEQQHLFDK